MNEGISTLASALGEFTFRRLVWLLCLGAVLAGGAIAFERASATVKLRRIERSVEVAKQLVSLDSVLPRNDTLLRAAQRELRSQLNSIVDEGPVAVRISTFAPATFSEGISRFLSAAAIWFLLSMGITNDGARAAEQKRVEAAGQRLPRGWKRVHGSEQGYRELARVGMLIGAVLGGIAIFLPVPGSALYYWVLVPFASLIVGLAITAIIELNSKIGSLDEPSGL